MQANTVARDVPVYLLGRFDKIDFRGVEYCHPVTNAHGYVLRRASDININEFFTYEEFYEALQAKEADVKRDWNRPTKAGIRAHLGITSLSDLDDKNKKVVLLRKEFCDRFLQLEQAGDASRSDASLDNAISLIAVEMGKLESRRSEKRKRCGTKREMNDPPSPSTLRTWLKAYSAASYDALALCPAYRRSGNVGSKAHPLALELAMKYAVRYGDSRRPTKIMLFREYLSEMRKRNKARAKAGEELVLPVSKRTFERKIDALDPYHILAAREGEEAARRHFGIVRAGVKAFRPLERIEIDDCQLSLQILLMAANVWEHLTTAQKAEVARTRVWATVAIDCATECILALRLRPEEPAGVTALACLEMCIADKSYVGDAAGAETVWDMHGTPCTIVADQGAPFISTEFHAACGELNIEIMHPPAKTPSMRGRIERVFRTFQHSVLHYFAGQTFENIIRKGDYDSTGNACVDIEQLNRTLIRFITDVYHNTPHAGLAGKTPRNAWRELTRKYGILPPPSRAVSRRVLGTKCKRVIGDRGIRILGIYYQSLELQKLRRIVRNDPVEVSVDRFDLGQIEVRTDTGWLGVRLGDETLDLQGVTLWEWAAAARDLARKHAAEALLSTDVVFAAIDDIRASGEMAVKRAEIGAPIMTTEELDKLDTRLFRTFEFGNPEISPEAPRDVQGQPKTKAIPPPAPSTRNTIIDADIVTVQGQFGSAEDLIEE